MGAIQSIFSTQDDWCDLGATKRRMIKAMILYRDGPYCNASNGHGCGKEFPLSELTMDHIIPLVEGGPMLDPANIQFLCAKCHAAKTSAEAKARNARMMWIPKRVINRFFAKLHRRHEELENIF